MPNIVDYLKWRGDLSLESVPFNDADFLALCRMAYVPMEGVVPAEFTAKPVPLADAAGKVLSLAGAQGDGRRFRIRDDEALLQCLTQSERFSSLRLVGYVNTFNPNNDEQFSAVTVLLPQGGFLVAFRGTDGTITGWKEDFNMAFSEAIPAQLDAVSYLTQAAAQFGGSIGLGGHSKGGNLAVYSAAFCSPDIQRRITAVRNFDGPGFSEKVFRKPQLQSIMGVTRTYLPQSSVIGMLLEHAEDFTIVESRSVGIYQHNVYLWEFDRDQFVSVESRTSSSQFIDATISEWISEMSPELREKMVNGLFTALKKADVKMLSDLANAKKIVAVMKAYSELDAETREVLSECFGRLKGALKSSVPALLERLKLNVKTDFSAAELFTIVRAAAKEHTDILHLQEN